MVPEPHTATVRHFDPDPRVVLLWRMLMLALLLLAAAMTWASLVLLGVLTTEVRWLQPDPRKSYAWDVAFGLAVTVLLLAEAWLFGVRMPPRQSDALTCDDDGIWLKAKGKVDGLVRWGAIASRHWRWPPHFNFCDRDGMFLLAVHPSLKGGGDLLLAIQERASPVSTRVPGKSRLAPYLWWVVVPVALGALLFVQYLIFQAVAECVLALQDDQARLARVLASPRLRGRPEVVSQAEGWVSEAWFDVGLSVFAALGTVIVTALGARFLGKIPIRVTVDAEGVECLWPYGRRRYRFAEIASVQLGTGLSTRLEPQLRLLDGRQIDMVVLEFLRTGFVPEGLRLCHEIRGGLDEFRARSAAAGRT